VANVTRSAWKTSLWIGPGVNWRRSKTPIRFGRARSIIENLGLEIAFADEAREILSLKGGDKVAFLELAGLDPITPPAGSQAGAPRVPTFDRMR